MFIDYDVWWKWLTRVVMSKKDKELWWQDSHNDKEDENSDQEKKQPVDPMRSMEDSLW
jgi:hypothetical protein